MGQNGALGTKKRPFLAQIGYAKKWIFLKNTIFKFVKIAQKVPFWVNNNVRKRWARSLDKKFSGSPVPSASPVLITNDKKTTFGGVKIFTYFFTRNVPTIRAPVGGNNTQVFIVLSTGQYSNTQLISLFTSVLSLSWGAARSFLIMRIAETADPDPEFATTGLRIWPYMLVS